MKFTLGLSPCPNDTFIFDALVNNKMDTAGITFEPVLEDVETLNQWAEEGKLDITKLSFPAFFQNKDKYILLNSGGALGKGVGPLLISKFPVPDSQFQNAVVALPGKNTTAHLLFSFAYPKVTKKRFMIFSAIEDAVLNEETDLGVIIHENRFTYQQKGLFKVIDLGEYWEEKMNIPIPLGGIAIKKSIDKSIALQIELLIRKSIGHAWAHYPQLSDFVKANAREMQEDIMRKHIELYVNDFSIDLNTGGRQAIASLYKLYSGSGDVSGQSVRSEELFLS